jgi:hypothetical protein
MIYINLEVFLLPIVSEMKLRPPFKCVNTVFAIQRLYLELSRNSRSFVRPAMALFSGFLL